MRKIITEHYSNYAFGFWFQGPLRQLDHGIVTGSKTYIFRHGRGQRREDPLSPLSIYLGQEIIHKLLEKEFRLKHISEVKVIGSGPSIMHVMHVDDVTVMELEICHWRAE